MSNSKLSLHERVRLLFFGELEAQRATLIQRRPGASPAALRPLAESAPGARLNVVGLEEVRERLGERWEALSERVHDLAAAVIRRHLARGDVFDRHGEDGYMILFASLSPPEAQFKCQVIAKEIAAKLLGADWAGRASVEGATFQLKRDTLDEIDFEAAVAHAVAGASPVIRIPQEPAPGRPDEVRTVAATATNRGAAPVNRRSGPGYAPVWDFGIDALLHFRALGGPSAYDDQPAPPLAAAKADVAALARALFEISQLVAKGRRLPVICPVSLSTMRDDALRSQLVRVLRQSDAEFRKLVTLEIVAPAGARAIWPAAFTPDKHSLPAACSVRLPLASDPRRLALTGIGQITLELPADFLPDKAGLARLDLFARCCLACRLPFGVMGLRSRPVALAATAAGFKQLAGAAIHPNVAELGQAVRFDLETLYRDLAPPGEAVSPPRPAAAQP